MRASDANHLCCTHTFAKKLFGLFGDLYRIATDVRPAIPVQRRLEQVLLGIQVKRITSCVEDSCVYLRS